VIYRQTASNPFEGIFKARPFQAALYARAGAHHEFKHPVKLNRRRRQTLGHYTSLIMQVSFPYHSSLELAAMQWLDLAHQTKVYWPQPGTFLYEMDGELRRYTPDIGVELHDGRGLMVEVKTRKDAEREENRLRWPLISETLARDGYGLAFLLDERLEAQPFGNYLRLLQQFRGAQFDPIQVGDLQNRLDNARPWTVAEVLPVMASRGFAQDQLFPLILYRHLGINLMEEVTERSRVWIPSRAPTFPIWGIRNAA